MGALSVRLLGALITSSVAGSGLIHEQSPELGRVAWRHDLDAVLAKEALAASDKPVLVLFQEVPGCSTCVGLGRAPLSHPLLVEAIEDDFVPVVVFNNKSGADASWLEHFHEPAWNNPVMRFLGRDGKDLIERRDRVWSTSEVAARMIDAKHEFLHGRRAPLYLDLARLESDREHHATCAFEMHCFWQGEAKLGAIDGVVGVEARSLGGREIVVVTYHTDELSITKLLMAADRLDCATNVFTTDDDQLRMACWVVGKRANAWDGKSQEASRSDRTHALNDSPLRFLPLTPMQAMKVNSCLAAGEIEQLWLSPRQLILLGKIETALARDAKALDGLERPSTVEALWDYTAALQRRL